MSLNHIKSHIIQIGKSTEGNDENPRQFNGCERTKVKKIKPNQNLHGLTYPFRLSIAVNGNDDNQKHMFIFMFVINTSSRIVKCPMVRNPICYVVHTIYFKQILKPWLGNS